MMTTLNKDPKTEMSLFSGIGGGVLGSEILGWQTLGYVEKEEFCRQILAERIADGWFNDGEIYGELSEFNKQHAHKYKDRIDVLTGGFPCQPHSVAGKRKGRDDDRYVFDEIIKAIEIIQPRWLFFENVPGLLADPAIIEIYETLSKAGYRLKPPLQLGSADCGACHQRQRVWIYAAHPSRQPCDASEYLESVHRREQKQKLRDSDGEVHAADDSSLRGNEWQDSGRKRPLLPSEFWQDAKNQPKWSQFFTRIDEGVDVFTANTSSQRVQRGDSGQVQGFGRYTSHQSVRGFEDFVHRPDIPQPLICGMDDALPSWSHVTDRHQGDPVKAGKARDRAMRGLLKARLKAIGNAQDPVVMATAWNILHNY